MVVPTPSAALLIPGAPCTPIEAVIPVCTFGAASAGATASVALLGDSHAEHWRAALQVASQALDWSAYDVTHPSCPFTKAILAQGNPQRDACIDWNQDVLQWFDQNPQISTVITSDHPGLVMTAPGVSETAARVAGITSAWAALPATVKHIIVIRDDPQIDGGTLPCVTKAIAEHEDAGLRCAFPRSGALHVDPDVLAAEKLHSSRVQIVDLTNFFCGSRLCYPVIGGALVYKDDFDHMTSTYSTTLGPYLLRSIRKLMTSWH
jgi:hypothetical protein